MNNKQNNFPNKYSSSTNNNNNYQAKKLNKDKIRDLENEEIENFMKIEWVKQGQEFIGYLVNMKPHKIEQEDKNEESHSALLLYFIDENGDNHKSVYAYEPYFFIIVKEDAPILDIQQQVSKKFEGKINSIELVEKIDLNMPNHLSGKKLKLIKLKFKNVSNLVHVRNQLRPIILKNKNREKNLFNIIDYNKLDDFDYLIDLREDDVPYHVRVCIDSEIRCGKWYSIKGLEEGCVIKCIEEKISKPDIRVLAFDIETTKEKLKFPDSKIDSVMMISYMIDGEGFLIINRSILTEDIDDFEYSPKIDFQGYFRVFNEIDEKSVLKRFSEQCLKNRINVFVTYNGDYFDLPFLEERFKFNGMKIETALGLTNSSSSIGGLDKEYTGRFSSHIDCLYWVKRDSFLPQGSHGLKAVTKNKLGYDPIELDPELMIDYAIKKPKQLCDYSVSDALSTFYIYKLMIHDFIFALSSIIPTFPDEVLRKGSGTLCEELLMAQAFRKDILFPNKQIDEFEKFHNGHLIENETYTGGHVECLNEGVFRHDIPVKFTLDLESYRILENNIDDYIKFCVEVENNEKIENLDENCLVEVKKAISSQLLNFIKGNPSIETLPLIYHLDVGAMYPNIILTNRLQPVSIVNESICSSCLYNNPINNCKREMSWSWKSDLFPLNRNEYESLKNQFEYEINQEGEFNMNSEEYKKKFLKRIKAYCSKAYKKIHIPKIEMREDVVCMRENSFYVDTVRDFRDRRYDLKIKTKNYKNKIKEAKEVKDRIKEEEYKILYDLYESLQIAYKVVLNSFYGYVMRKGARWFSMEMAAMVTYTGTQIIRDSKNLIDKVGIPLELDTDGIWGLLPKGFPEEYSLKIKTGKKLNFNFPCTMLNHLIYDKYSNYQYQYLEDEEYKTKREMSIFFEVDGPYGCMMIPASKEEGKKLKKRYAVFTLKGDIKELKGFELKRRGELKIIKIFQEQVFLNFLKGNTLSDCYKECAKVAEKWYKILENKGQGITEDELLEYIQETKILSKTINEYGAQKSTSLTCARRQADLQKLTNIGKEKGFCVNYIISKKPEGTSVAERAIPVLVFQSNKQEKEQKLREWLRDFTEKDLNMKEVIDWEYYKERLASTILKIIIIPAAIQKVENPMTNIKCPDWVNKMVKDKFKPQKKLNMYFKETQKFATQNLEFGSKPKEEKAIKTEIKDIEDIAQVNIEVEDEKSNIFNNFNLWLKQQKNKWNDIAIAGIKRKAITPVKNKLFSNTNAIDKETTFKQNILKVIKISEEIKPGELSLWIKYGQYLERIIIKAKRKIYIHSHEANKSSEFMKIVKLKLPRNKPLKNLYELEIQEDKFKENSNKFNDYLIDKSTEGVYETKIPLVHKLVQSLGSQIFYKKKKVNMNDLFDLDDFDPRINENYHLNSNDFSNIYLYNSYKGTKQILVLLIDKIDDNEIKKPVVYFFICSSISKNLVEIPNLKSVIIKTLNNNFDNKKFLNGLDFDLFTHYEIDFKKAIQAVKEIIYKFKNNSILTIQSYQDLKLNMNNVLPVVELNFNMNDNDFPGIDWIKFACVKFSYRLVEFYDVSDIKLRLANYCNIPFCNIEKDVPIYCCDIIFSRILKQNNNILWYSDGVEPDLGGGDDFNDFLGDLENDNTYVKFQGMYLGYTAEINIGLFAVNAIKASENLKEIDGFNITTPVNNNSIMEYHLERDETFLSENAFICIKKLIDQILIDVSNQVDVADYLIAHFYRWISSPTSKFFDPIIHRNVNKKMHQNFSVFTKILKAMDFNIIYADTKKLIIFNNKSNINEFQVKIEQLIISLNNNPFFTNLSFSLNSIWKCLLFKDLFNYAGVLEGEDDENSQIKVINKWNVIDFLPKILEKDFLSLITDYICKLTRFFYYKDVDMVKNLINIYDDFSLSKDFISKVEKCRENHLNALKGNFSTAKNFLNEEIVRNLNNEFKSFMIKNYIQTKLLNMIPTIIRKELTYEDDELEGEGIEVENLESMEQEKYKVKEDVLKNENNSEDEEQLNEHNEIYQMEPKLFTKQDFEGDDYDGSQFEEPQEQHKMLNPRVKKVDESRWIFRNPLGSFLSYTNLSLEYIKVFF